MDDNRLINNVFSLAPVDNIGVAFNKLIRSSDSLLEWTNGHILRSSSAFEPIEGVPTPYILNQILTTSSEFRANVRQRKTVVCGSLFVWEEPYLELQDDDITIVSVVDEFERILLSDPHLKIDDAVIKTERIHRFELSSYGGKPEHDKVTIYAAYHVEYIVDINFISRQRM